MATFTKRKRRKQWMYLCCCWILLTACGSPASTNEGPKSAHSWQPKFKYVKAYEYNVSGHLSDYVVIDAGLHPSVTDTVGQTLSDRQVRQVLGILNGQLGTDEDLVAECFIPRHGLVFYNGQRQPVAHVSICFECNQLRVVPDNRLANRGMPLFRRLFGDLGVLPARK